MDKAEHKSFQEPDETREFLPRPRPGAGSHVG